MLTIDWPVDCEVEEAIAEEESGGAGQFPSPERFCLQSKPIDSLVVGCISGMRVLKLRASGVKRRERERGKAGKVRGRKNAAAEWGRPEAGSTKSRYVIASRVRLNPGCRIRFRGDGNKAIWWERDQAHQQTPITLTGLQPLLPTEHMQGSSKLDR